LSDAVSSKFPNAERYYGSLGGCPRIEEPTAEKPFQSDFSIKCVKYTQYYALNIPNIRLILSKNLIEMTSPRDGFYSRTAS